MPSRDKQSTLNQRPHAHPTAGWAWHPFVALAIAAVLVVGLAGCSSNRRHTEPGRTYDASSGFSIAIPKEWSCEGPIAGSIIRACGPVEGDFVVNATANAARDDGRPLKELSAIGRSKLAACVLVSESEMVIDSKPAYVQVVRYKPQAVELCGIQYLVRGSRWLYLVSFVAPAEQFEKYRPTFEQVAATIRVD